MARPKSIEIANRDMRIVQLVEQGHKYRDVAKSENISVSRVSQIVNAHNQVVPDDEKRSELIIRLESYIHDVVEPLIHGPGKLMVSSGKGTVVVHPEGHPQAGEVVYDPSFKLEAVRTADTLWKSVAKLGAYDKQKPLVIEEKQVDTTQLDAMVENYERIMQERHDALARVELLEAGGVVEADVIDPAAGKRGD